MFVCSYTPCQVENVPPKKTRKFRRVGGVHDYGILRAWGGNVFWNFRRQGGIKTWKPSVVGYGYFLELPIYRNGNVVLLAKTGHITCPYNLLNRYIQAAGIDFSSSLMFFRSLHFVKSNASYTLRSTGISYTRTREVVLHAFSQLGYSTKLFGLHSLRSGGATAAANAGVNDRLFKRHGRWRSDKAKDGYIKDNLEALLSVSLFY